MRRSRICVAWLLCAVLLLSVTACNATPTDSVVSGSDTTTTAPSGETTTTTSAETTTTTAATTAASTTAQPSTTVANVSATTTTTKQSVSVNDDGKHIAFRDTSANGGTIGVWWWSAADAKSSSKSTRYLEFLYENQVSEIYLWANGMTNADIATFIRKAGSYGMRVAWLTGDASWINSQDISHVTAYLNYQAQAADDAKFYGMHFDVEPHQLGGFASNRASIMQKFAEYIGFVSDKLHNAGEKVEWDIPFWLEGEAADRVTMNGKTMGILSYIAGVSDTICLMSYRDTADQILAVSAEEIALAKQYGCKVICGVETYSEEGDAVSFMEEGKVEMYKQLKTVYQTLAAKGLTAYGVAIHYMPQWYNLKD